MQYELPNCVMAQATEKDSNTLQVNLASLLSCSFLCDILTKLEKLQSLDAGCKQQARIELTGRQLAKLWSTALLSQGAASIPFRKYVYTCVGTCAHV